MPDKRSDKETAGNSLKRTIRSLAPWYGGAIAIYAPIQTVYGWLHSSGLVRTEWYDTIFIFCRIGGLLAVFGVIGSLFGRILGEGVIAEFFGFTDAIRRQIIWVCTVVAGSGMAIYILVLVSPGFRQDFNEAPKYDSADWVFASIGAAVLSVTYALCGKKLFDILKTIKAALKEEP